MSQTFERQLISQKTSTKQFSKRSQGKLLSEYSAREIGLEGEDIAAAFLERRGYTILDRNWVSNAGEADIVTLAPHEFPEKHVTSDGFSELQHSECISVVSGKPDTPKKCTNLEKDSTDVVQSLNEVVLVEVKTRLALHDSENTMPEIAVGKRKQQRYRKIALMYLALHSEYDAVRFDVIAINIVGESLARLRHLIGAYSWED